MTSGILGNLIGPDSIIIVVAIVLVLLFGGSRLPKLARGLGSASHEFRKGLEEGDADDAEKKVEPTDKA
jgi:sec-independent protein translocase protein TatA